MPETTPVIRPYIPLNITVHLGNPDEDVGNVTVTFPDYIKNVASSEIYPTWDESAIYANIYAQISFALNKIYLEYYRSRGYDFNITSSTAYDQKFIWGRNIFDNIDRIVDNIFSTYIRRQGFVEPLSARYCNGTTVTCDGMSQWGSQDLALQSYDSVEILRYYYGDDIELVPDAPIQAIRSSYPGYPIGIGDTGQNVAALQTMLNQVSQNYPSIPKVYPIDGIFGPSTENALTTFQRIFNLEPDGLADRATWNKLVFLYTGVLQLAELESEGQRFFGSTWEYPDLLEPGSSGGKVYLLQYLLSMISEFNNAVAPLQVTGSFDPQTSSSVTEFQRLSGLPQTGIVDNATWDAIYSQYKGIVDTVLDNENLFPVSIPPFSGIELQLASEGDEVAFVQNALNLLQNTQYSVTGTYNRQNSASVQSFQQANNLPVTGNVDQATWDEIVSAYRENRSAVATHPLQFLGYNLTEGMQDNF